MAKRSAQDVAATTGVILNPRSGYVTRHAVMDTVTLIQDALPHAQIHVLDPLDDVMLCCQELLSSGATTLVAAGGDGTVNGVAAILAGHGMVLGVLPVGTFNHFARDIGLAHGMRHALQVLRAGHVKTIDVASVNGNLFLNNSSIGLYPRLVQLRDRVGQRHGRGPATLEAALLMAQQPYPSRVSFTAAGRTQTFHGSFLFVGNNRYEPDPLHRRFRSRLDEGVLSCLILDEPDPGHFTASATRLPQENHLHHHGPHALATSQLIVVLTTDDTTPVSTDGEVRLLRPPLDYRICPQALRVIVPQSTGSPSERGTS
ncbi:MAG TPA: diacylglycerol kinase family protein [Chloroflexota bacterium]